MNDIEKRIEEILFGRPETAPAMKEKESIQDWEYRRELDRKSWQSARLLTLYHQLLLEERKRLIGVVEGMMTPPMDWEYDDRDGSQYCKGCNYSPKEGCHCATKNAALTALLATLNKEKN